MRSIFFFLEKFEEAHSEELQQEETAKQFECVKSYKYFLRLVCLISLFWFLWGVLYFDYNKLTKKKSFDYLSYSLDRLFIFKNAYNELKERKATF